MKPNLLIRWVAVLLVPGLAFGDVSAYRGIGVSANHGVCLLAGTPTRRHADTCPLFDSQALAEQPGSIPFTTGSEKLAKEAVETARQAGVAPAAPAAGLVPANPVRQKVLVAEDDPSLQRMMEMILTGAGYAVEAFGDGPAALQAFSRNPSDYAAAVLDADLGTMSGLDLARQLRSVNGQLPILFSSGASGQYLQSEVSKLEAKFLPKPFLPKALTDSVRDLLSKPVAMMPGIPAPEPDEKPVPPVASMPTEVQKVLTDDQREILKRQDHLTLAMAVIDHGGHALDITARTTTIVSALKMLSVFDEPLSDVADSILAIVKEYKGDSEYKGDIKHALQRLATQRVQDLTGITRKQIDALQDRIQNWVDLMGSALREALAGLVAHGADATDKSNAFGIAAASAQRTILNVDGVKSLYLGIPYAIPLSLSGLDKGTKEGGPWGTKQHQPYPIFFDPVEGLPSIKVFPPLFHIALERLFENCFEAIDKILENLTGDLREIARAELGYVQASAQNCTLPDGRRGVRIILRNPGHLPTGLMEIDPLTKEPYLYSVNYVQRAENVSEHGVGLKMAVRAFKRMGGVVYMHDTPSVNGIAMVETVIELPAAEESAGQGRPLPLRDKEAA